MKRNNMLGEIKKETLNYIGQWFQTGGPQTLGGLENPPRGHIPTNCVRHPVWGERTETHKIATTCMSHARSQHPKMCVLGHHVRSWLPKNVFWGAISQCEISWYYFAQNGLRALAGKTWFFWDTCGVLWMWGLFHGKHVFYHWAMGLPVNMCILKYHLEGKGVFLRLEVQGYLAWGIRNLKALVVCSAYLPQTNLLMRVMWFLFLYTLLNIKWEQFSKLLQGTEPV